MVAIRATNVRIAVIAENVGSMSNRMIMLGLFLIPYILFTLERLLILGTPSLTKLRGAAIPPRLAEIFRLFKTDNKESL